MRLDTAEARRRATDADHGILATLHPERGVDAVPACFVLDGEVVAIAIDEVKPKASPDLQRVRNLQRDPRAALLVEGWDAADWSRLWWVRLSLRRSDEQPPVGARCEALLRAKYPQYATAGLSAVVTFRVTAIRGWAASERQEVNSAG
jgi:PPOX class probable F420-dependent enzyme